MDEDMSILRPLAFLKLKDYIFFLFCGNKGFEIKKTLKKTWPKVKQVYLKNGITCKICSISCCFDSVFNCRFQ
jgi:hypothetical protein